MIDEDVHTLLTDAAERSGGRSPHIAEMVAAAGRVRHRRRAALCVVGAAATAAVLVTAALPSRPPDRVTAEPPVTASREAAAPEGTRLVGVGSVAIAVPRSWATNAMQCGTPREDTVVIDVAAVERCLSPRPRDVDSVAITGEGRASTSRRTAGLRSTASLLAGKTPRAPRVAGRTDLCAPGRCSSRA